MSIHERITEKNILVVGDLMVDHYTFGKVKRISPEAPVPVLQVEREQHLPGGTGNVMCNLAALGMKVFALCRTGDDPAGTLCQGLLEAKGIDTRGVIKDHSFTTPIKNRLIADTQQLVRVDYEKVKPLNEEDESKVIRNCITYLPKMHAIVISDYAKGFCSSSLLEFLLENAKELKIPVIVDPKSNRFDRYKGATLLKPNLAEAIRAANLPEGASLDSVAQVILENTFCNHLMITRAHEGISIFSAKGGRKDFPALIREVKDVTGAGDTVCAVVTASLANDLPLEEATILANKAASYSVQRVGCVQVSLKELASI